MTTFQLQDLQHPYNVYRHIYSPDEVAILRHASELLARPLKRQSFTEPDVVKDYLRCKLAGLEFEIFGAMFLDSQVQLIADEVLFRGTVSATTVYPREVVRKAICHNASHILVYHNHPSLSVEPSRADERLTSVLVQALALIDVKVQDHFVVAGDGSITSFAQKGLL